MFYQDTDSSMHRHLSEAFKYFCFIEEGAVHAAVPTSIIFGIGSRESAWGIALKPKGPSGTGDRIPRKYMTKYRTTSLPPDGGGFGRGLMQIDYDAHAFARTNEEWKDAKKNIMYGGSVLKDNISFMRKQSTFQLSEKEILQAGIAAYNCGAGNVIRSLAAGDPIDQRTAHHNYSIDVAARADWFERVGGWRALQKD